MSQDLTCKEVIAQSLVRKDNSARTVQELPPVGSYRCMICDYTIIGEIDCIDHVLKEHDAELQVEMVMKA